MNGVCYNKFVVNFLLKEVLMIGYVGPIEQLTEGNTNFRQVLFTGTYCQLVVMSLLPNEEIGLETHATVDQFFV